MENEGLGEIHRSSVSAKADNTFDCCSPTESSANLKSGLLLGLLPHSFCIAFIILSILGATTATTLLRPLMLNRYFFSLLVLITILLATVSALIYLQRRRSLSWAGVKRSWRYLTILYATMIGVNLLLFMVVFPLTANLNFSGRSRAQVLGQTLAATTLQVALPCPGHALLVSGELAKVPGVIDVKYRLPNYFDVTYLPEKTSVVALLDQEIFKSFKAEEVTP